MGKASELGTLVRRSLRAARLEAYRVRRERAGGQDAGGLEAQVAMADVPGGAEVLLYFGDDPDNLYQARQWLPILERLHARHRVAVLCRHGLAFERLVRETELPVVLVRSFRDLEPFYDAAGVKVCLYVNAHPLNFQSLAFTDQRHVHLNHGESDKISMASNHAKAYDHVVVAGEAAVERYRLNLLGYDGANLRKVGRPQLDLLPPHRPSRDGRTTVLYAPTWEGGRAQMDYSSVATMGEGIVEALLAAGFRVVYRPHPKTGVEDATVRAVHDRILERIADAGAPHRVSVQEPIGEALADAEVLVADVSSVLLDFLPTGRPFFVAHPVRRQGTLLDTGDRSDAAGYPLAPADVGDLPGLIEKVMAHDPRRGERLALIARFFGDTAPGASTQRFIDAIAAIVSERDELLAAKRARLDTR